jgi:hypothetical protein
VNALPENGQANEAVIRLLAETLALPRSAVSIVRGLTGRDKIVLLDGITPEALDGRLEAAVSRARSAS